MPDQLDDYIHRIGRTGRAGSTGRSVTLATPQQKREVAMLEKMIKMEIPRSGLDLQKLEPLRVDPRAADREIAPRRHAETANHQQHRDFRATDSRRGPRPERRGNDRGPRPERTTYERAPRPERQDVQPKPEVRPPDFAQPLEAPKDFTPRGTRGGRGGGKKPAFDSNWTAPPSEGAGRAERPQADRAPRQDRPWADRRPNGDRPTGPRPPADSRVPKPGPAGPPSAKHRKGGASAPKRAGFAKPDAAGNPFGKFFGKKGAKKRA
jgi:superfamily II DNA/RNA helicase